MNIYGNFVRPIGQVATGRVKIGKTPTEVSVTKGRQCVDRHTILVALPASSPATAVYFGGKDVTVGTGFPIEAGNGQILPLNNQAGVGRVWMVADKPCEVMVAEFTE